MKTLALISALAPQRLTSLDGKPLSQWVDSALTRALGNIPRLWLHYEGAPFLDVPEEVKRTVPFEIAGLERTVEKLAEGYDEVLWLEGDEPFIRPDLITRLVELHRDYHADYTFADGFPQGLAPEVIHPRILPTLRKFAEKNALNNPTIEEKKNIPLRSPWFDLISQDINAFDIETELSPVDLRAERLSFRADSPRQRLLLERWLDEAQGPLQPFLEALRDNPLKRRTLPATLQLQVTNGVRQVPLWSPLHHFFPQALSSRDFLEEGKFREWVSQALDWAGDLTLMPSFWGEPSLHPQIKELFLWALTQNNLRLVIETSGLGWRENDLADLAQAAKGRLDWIVELDSQNSQTYLRIRGEGFEEAQAFTQKILQGFSGHVWPQTVRMNETEEETEGFYRYWKEQAGQAIILKYNSYGGKLPKRKPADLSPWRRLPCWHLQRDLAVFMDGTVVPCRDAWKQNLILGNLHTDSWQSIWEASGRLLQEHAQENYPEVCRNCDEYYTFFF